jgi:hypothetical protein
MKKVVITSCVDIPQKSFFHKITSLQQNKQPQLSRVMLREEIPSEGEGAFNICRLPKGNKTNEKTTRLETLRLKDSRIKAKTKRRKARRSLFIIFR